MNTKLMTMVMVYKDDLVLVQDRQKEYWSGIGFPGGHVELNESIVESAIREVKEETNLEIKNLEFCGYKSWDDDKKSVVMLFKSNDFSGELKDSSEGNHFWVSKNDIFNLNLAVGFEDDLKMFFTGEISEIHYDRDGDKYIPNIRKI